MSFPLFFENEIQAQSTGNDSVSLKTTVQPTYSGDLLPSIPQKSNFTFGSGSPFCPANDCKQELTGAFYSITSSAYPGIQGTSILDIIKYSTIPFAGNFRITGIEENNW